MSPVLLMILSSFIYVVQVASLQDLTVRHADTLIEVNAVGATKNSEYGIFDEDSAISSKKSTWGSVGRQACVDQATRRRSDVSCARLAGLEGPPPGGPRWNDFTRDHGNLCTTDKAASRDGANQWEKNIEPGEAATTCCATCAEAPVFIAFGSDSREHTDVYGALSRPEELRVFQCRSADDCQACKSTANCFHGHGGGGGLKIDVPARAAFALYRAEVRTKCPPHSTGIEAQWSVSVGQKLKNAELKVYKNKVWQHTFTSGTSRDHGEWRQQMTAGFQSLQVDFIPLDSAQASSATGGLILKAFQVSKAFEHCQDSKNCLNIFGDGSQAGFTLRNSNPDQYRCLIGGSLDIGLNEKCNAWKACMLSPQNGLIETADKTDENAAGAIESEIGSENLKASNLEQLQKRAVIAIEPETVLEDRASQVLKPGVVAVLFERPGCRGKFKVLRVSNLNDGRLKDGWSRCGQKWDNGAPFVPQSRPRSLRVGDGFLITMPAHQGCHDQVNFGLDKHVATNRGQVFGGGGCKNPARPVDFIRYRYRSPGHKQIDFLTAFMRAAGIQSTSSSLVGSVAAEDKRQERKLSTVTDAPGCFHPENADVEAWDCECMDQMTEACDGVDESCFARHMCAHADVCGSWKTFNNCASSLMESMASRSVHSNEREGSNITLDSTVSGKCTTSTRS